MFVDSENVHCMKSRPEHGSIFEENQIDPSQRFKKT